MCLVEDLLEELDLLWLVVQLEGLGLLGLHSIVLRPGSELL